MRTLVSTLGVLLVLVAIAAGLIWSGTFNVAATHPHYDATRWLLVTIRNRSIAEHSADIEPPALDKSGLVSAGLSQYHTMCRRCHGAPGRDPEPFAQGLNPEPPDLTSEPVQARSDAELFWIIKHGLRMTAMPAFGPRHKDQAIWALVTLLRQLPEMTPEAYTAQVKEAGL